MELKKKSLIMESLSVNAMREKLVVKYPKATIWDLTDEVDKTKVYGFKVDAYSTNKVGVRLFDSEGIKELYDKGVSRAFIIFLKGYGWEVFGNTKLGCSIVPSDLLK